MRSKMIFLGLALASTFVQSSTISAAPPPCGAQYCAGKPSNTSCRCPPETDSPLALTVCGGWTHACYYD